MDERTKDTKRSRRSIALAMATGIVLSACAPSEKQLAFLEEGRQWTTPTQSVDPMTGLTTWTVRSPSLQLEGYGLASALIFVGCSTNEGPMSVEAKVMAEMGSGLLVATIVLVGMDWHDWANIERAEAGLWSHDVLLQWDGDVTKTNEMSLVGGYGAPVGIRGDQTA